MTFHEDGNEYLKQVVFMTNFRSVHLPTAQRSCDTRVCPSLATEGSQKQQELCPKYAATLQENVSTGRCKWCLKHTEKYFRNLIKSTRNPIVFTIFWLIWIQPEIRLDPNQPENGKYNLISGWFNKISRKKLSVCTSVCTNTSISFILFILLSGWLI